ncbi:restriction endonuclease [Methanobrevibacter curvatus]|uniref:Tsp45I type II restriction enzyme n=1 Tax=Methanobrevibacter curvatus TaxID=49547 RepID=A0A166AMT9_9EURY|nr:restriction endonuclease [Methanobrevibacter curvatus]KZX12241.1 Tsp45I type II restriction enzyme [Methanobrevibacter curvatus]
MNYWTKLSVDYASQKSYLDDLFQIYPTIPEGIRDIDNELWKDVETSFKLRDNINLIKNLLKLELFPIKDSYVAFLRKYPKSIDLNPKTINRLSSRLYEMGLNEIFNKSTEPKETNRQMGPKFQNWINKGFLGFDLVNSDEFLKSKDDAILKGSDLQLQNFAEEHLNYTSNKGLDFIGRFNNEYVIAEAKFLTDFGGHQNAQFRDATALLNDDSVNAIRIAILDGVLYIKGKNKMYKYIEKNDDKIILSSLLLREFLYSI